MEFLKRCLSLLAIFLLVFLVACSIPTEKVCSVDSDCIAAQCCHATSAVNKENAPDCSGILCTMNCAPDTLDCGQGEIKCVEGSCEAVFE